MEKYKCDVCDYVTNKQFCYKRHINTQKHKEKQIEISNNTKQEDSIILSELNKCMFCHKFCTTSSGLSKHQKKCLKHREMTLKIENLEKELLNRENIIKDKERTVCELIKTLEYERVKEKAHLSASNYLSVTYNSAPNLPILSDFSIFEEDNNELLDMLITAYQEDNLVEFIGNAIVSYYKTENPNNQSLWNSDTERLTYFIRKNFNWSIDKKGIKTGNLIVHPALSYFNEKLKEYVISDVSRNLSVDQVLADHKRRRICHKIMLDIEHGTLLTQILKFMAPRLFLDKKLKYIEPTS